ncbi:MAG: hypothetical protein QOG50_3860 [Actinomycetota bacterium]|jgi:hypothetical protein|nr:hypothetical protein [Actinomycetota bacterium]
MHRNAGWACWGLLVGAVAVAGCGSSTTHVAVPGATTTTTGAGAVNPNGTEVLPPGDIPDNQVFVVYSPASGGYSIRYPQGWPQRVSGRTSTFSQNFNRIEITTTKSSTRPTEASVRTSDVPKLRALAGFKLVKIDSVKRAAGDAIRIAYAAASTTDPVTGKRVALDVERYLFWHNGTLVSITLSSPKGSDNVDPWKTVTDSLVWK